MVEGEEVASTAAKVLGVVTGHHQAATLGADPRPPGVTGAELDLPATLTTTEELPAGVKWTLDRTGVSRGENRPCAENRKPGEDQ